MEGREFRAVSYTHLDVYKRQGYANGGYHAWNIVYIDGKYYNVDLSWDDSLGDVSNTYSLDVYKRQSDDFTSDKLGMQWQWNANPQKDWYELTGSKLKLNALDTVPLRPVSDYRNLLLQKWPAPDVYKRQVRNRCKGNHRC